MYGTATISFIISRDFNILKYKRRNCENEFEKN